MKDEITLEITNFCPHKCRFCSSDAINDIEKATFMDVITVHKVLHGTTFKHIIISGGEPLAHPNFYEIYRECACHTEDVVVYSNLIKHRVYNLHVIDGVYLEANVTPTPETDKIHILRRVKQGKEADRPEVHLSRNHSEDCSCDHRVVKPNGDIMRAPCDKWKKSIPY